MQATIKTSMVFILAAGITVSAGAAERNHRNSGPEDVLRASDKALYRAKQAGRNQVCK